MSHFSGQSPKNSEEGKGGKTKSNTENIRKYIEKVTAVKTKLLLCFLVCGIVFPEDGGSGRHRNISEFSLTV
jgi:hypothetical protein